MSLIAGQAVAAGEPPEGLTIVFRITGPEWERMATHYYTASKVRFDQGDQATVVDLRSGRITNISASRKQYSETTFAEIEQAMTSLSAHMEKAMAGIPEELRKKMMGDSARDVTVTKGEIDTVAGVACQRHLLSLGPKTRMEVCASVSLDLPFDKTHSRNLTLVSAPIAKGNSGLNKMVERLRGIEGLSLASSTVLTLMGKRVETTSRATEVRAGRIEDARFETPGDFKKVESPFAKMAR